MEKQKADLSLIAANYNNGKYLTDFIESILGSTVLPSELIIIDDGSTDNSREVLSVYAHLDIARFIFLEKNQGFAHALNAGIEAATSTWIMRADPDDMMHATRIEKQMAFLRDHNELDGAGCNVIYYHSEKQRILNRSNFPVSEEGVRNAYLKGEHGIQHPTVVVKRSVILQFLYRQEYVPAEDYDVYARMVSAGHRFSNMNDVLYTMRIHSASASSNLCFDTIRQTYKLREEIFGFQTPVFRQRLYFMHMLCYRKYLLGRCFILRAACLMVSILCYPGKLYRRLPLLFHRRNLAY